MSKDNKDVKQEVYNDVLHPALSTVGTTLEGVVRVALAPVTAMVWGYKKIAAFLDKAIPAYFEKRRIAKEKIKSPDPAVAVPILCAMTYTSHREEIRDMFVNLLGASMNADSTDSHPSFVEIIKQITPDECRMLKYLHSDSRMPIVKYRYKVDENGGEADLTPYFSDICQRADCELPQKFPEYLDNLHRLGLVEIFYDRFLTDEKYYDELRANPDLPKVKVSGQIEVIEKKSFYELTAFGQKFCSVCMD